MDIKKYLELNEKNALKIVTDSKTGLKRKFIAVNVHGRKEG